MTEAIVEYVANDGQTVKLSEQLVAQYIVTGSAEAERKDVMRFMAICQARKLNPLAGDAYMTTYKNRDGSTTATAIVSKDYYVRTAQQQDDYDGMQAGVVVAKSDGSGGALLEYREGALVGKSEKLVGGWATVYSTKRSHPSKAVVSLDEYHQGRGLWNSKPATMIRKVAVVQAIREAYESVFGGLYDEAEMPEQERPEPVQAEPVQAEVLAPEYEYEEEEAF